MKLSKPLQSAIIAHAKREYPNECCGLVIDGRYYPCANIAPKPSEHFVIAPDAYLALSEMGEVQAIVHSHPNGEALPSEVDKIQMGVHGVDWLIMAIAKDVMTGDWQTTIKCHKAHTHHAPLLGREYVHGVQDCYGIVQDYYARELGIILPDFERADDWWEDEHHEPLYVGNFAKAGFVQISLSELQPHDVILCRVGRTYHINHALIFLGDYRLISESAPCCWQQSSLTSPARQIVRA